LYTQNKLPYQKISFKFATGLPAVGGEQRRRHNDSRSGNDVTQPEEYFSLFSSSRRCR